MNVDKKSIAAVFVCTLLFFAYMTYLQRKYPDYYAGQKAVEPATPTQEVAPPAQQAAPAVAPTTTTELEAPAPAAVNLLRPEQLTIETKTRVFRFDPINGGIASILLKDFQTDLKSQQSVELLDSPMKLQGTSTIQDKAQKNDFTASRDGNTLRMSRTDGVWQIEQVYSVPEDGYGLDVKVNFKNTSAMAQDLTGGVLVHEDIALPHKASGGFFGFGGGSTQDATTFVYGLDGKLQEKQMKDLCDEDAKGPAYSLNGERLDFLGVDHHYFLSFLWAKGQPMNYVLERSAPANSLFCPTTLTIWQKFGLVEGGGSVAIDLSGYFGPKQVDILKAHDAVLTSSVKLGWFSFFAHPLMSVLSELHKWVKNWGVAIILITLLLKIMFYPLTRAAAVSMKKMQKLQPQMTEIREKFKADPPRQQKELMAFMAQNKVNPFKGCLPILPQIPVFIAFYNLLSQAIELRHAPFYGWITDLASKDPYYITPVLLGVGMFLQQKLTPNPGMDKNQEKIMLMMPVIFALMMLSMPAGMVLYMITNTIVSIGQQQWLNRKLAKQFG